jgi:hypothetical protein
VTVIKVLHPDGNNSNINMTSNQDLLLWCRREHMQVIPQLSIKTPFQELDKHLKLTRFEHVYGYTREFFTDILVQELAGKCKMSFEAIKALKKALTVTGAFELAICLYADTRGLGNSDVSSLLVQATSTVIQYAQTSYTAMKDEAKKLLSKDVKDFRQDWSTTEFAVFDAMMQLTNVDKYPALSGADTDIHAHLMGSYLLNRIQL